jgi:dihydroorotate dehydrogenase
MNSICTQIDLERPPFFVGAGVIKEPDQIRRYADMPEVAAQVMGSYSWDEWGGNDPTGTKRVFYYDSLRASAWNAIGLQNMGHFEAGRFLPEEVKRVKAAGQLAVVSLTSLLHEDARRILPDLAGWAVEVGADVVELNGSCPNEGEHEVLCNDTEKTLEAIDRVRSKIGNEIYLTLKVSPLEHDTIRRYVEAKVAVDGIVAVNNQRRLSPYDPATEQSVIEVKDGYAGQSGPVISLSARRNLKAWLAAGEDRYELWSIGGIDNGHEAFHRVQQGAVLAGGAQAFYRVNCPERELHKWAEQYQQCVANKAQR